MEPDEHAEVTFANLPQSVGQISHGLPFVLGPGEQEAFEKASWLDKAYADEVEEYPDDLVEGFLLLSMLDAAAALGSPHRSETMWGLNYGLDRVRFVAPVHYGDRVLSTFETLKVEPKGSGYKVLRRCIFTVEGQDTPAMLADWWSLVLPHGDLGTIRRA